MPALLLFREQNLKNVGFQPSHYGLENHGLENIRTVYWNLSAAPLLEKAFLRQEGHMTKHGAFIALTGEHTGRSPNDRFIVEDDNTKDDVWWGEVNRPITPDHFQGVLEKIQKHLSGKDVFVQDCYCGANPSHRLRIRQISENAWHSLFARNMFIQPAAESLEAFEPEFTVIQAPSLLADPALDGTSSGTFILVNLTKRMILVGGSAYAGEIKKSIFSIMNYFMPAQGVLPMHCSANVGSKGDAAIFFGLSGTGKTTLSADSSRTLIGDDEHGWGDDGIFNFEGGCYAKTINLTHKAEPEIYELCHTFGSIIENVAMDPVTRELDFFDSRITENGRVSYDLTKVSNASATGVTGHPKNIVMLTCDAFGVLPPISQLSSDQAMYHFLSGYTAKVAGTERGLKEPAATFSTCFGAPFMPRHPSTYAKLLGEKMAVNKANCWLVNTGWSGGGYGKGERMKIAYTRAMLNAALSGGLEGVDLQADPNFGVLVPQVCPEVPADVLNPRNTWDDASAYDGQAQNLTRRFEENFKQFENHVDEQVKAVAIRAAA